MPMMIFGRSRGYFFSGKGEVRCSEGAFGAIFSFALPPRKRLHSTGKTGTAGLCGIELNSNDGRWDKLVSNCIQTCDKIVGELRNYKALSGSQIIRKLDRISDTLCSVADPAGLISTLHPNRKIAELAVDASVQIGKKIVSYNADSFLYEAVVYSLEKKGEELTREERFVGNQLKTEFEHQGLLLGDNDKRLFSQLQSRIQEISFDFRQLQSIQLDFAGDDFICDRVDLLDAVNVSFGDVGDGKVEIVPDFHNLNSLLVECSDEEMRRKAFMALKRGDGCLVELLEEILRLRHESANLLKFKNYSDSYAWYRVIKRQEDIYSFLSFLLDAIGPKLREELTLLRAGKLRDSPRAILQEYDIQYYQNRLKSRCDLSSYFRSDNVIGGFCQLLGRLFGIRIEVNKCSSHEMWHPTVFKLDFFDGPTGEYLSSLYCDFYARKNKNVDATFPIRFRSQWSRHAALALSLNWESPPRDQPLLLSHSQVVVLFHELGHAIQGLLSENALQHFSGMRGLIDHLETPSQLFQRFAMDYRVLRTFARHYKTGQILPEEMLQLQLQNQAKFAAMDMNYQIMLSLIDQKYHSTEIKGGISTAIYRDVINKYGIVPFVEGTLPQSSFSHLIGYGSAYYGYLYSAAHSSQLWNSLFQRDPLSSEAGMVYRSKFLAFGGAKEATEILLDITNEPLNLNHLISDMHKGMN